MKRHIKINGLLPILLVAAGVLFFVSCNNEAWDKHYNAEPKVYAGENLWAAIKANPNIKKFAWAVKQTGYDKVLASSQTFTVFAPDDASATNIDTTNVGMSKDDLLKKYVQNHVARFAFSASDGVNANVLFMNKKIGHFSEKNANFQIEDNVLKIKNLYAGNGLLHIIDKPIPFFKNIWEFLTMPEMDSLRKYLYAYNIKWFDEKKSVKGDIVNGRQVYLDSVYYEYNSQFYNIGYLSSEDSTYSVIMPNNKAWIKSYEKIKNYYRYNRVNGGITAVTADTLQRNYTRIALIQDMSFSNSQDMTKDSLMSTYNSMSGITSYGSYYFDLLRNKFYKPFTGLTPSNASNGTVYITDEMKFKPWESWHKEIRVEAEFSIGRTGLLSNIANRNYSEYEYIISKNMYIEVTPTTPSIEGNGVTFEIPGTLSGKLNADNTIQAGGAYRIYVVFAPNILKIDNPKPSKVSFVLSYTGENGSIINTAYTNNNTGFETSKDQMTKVLVAPKVVFPYSEYGLRTTTVKLNIKNFAKSKETDKFTKDMLIDCIIFEPVQE